MRGRVGGDAERDGGPMRALGWAQLGTVSAAREGG
jgi:hypothetical protein